MLRRRLIALAVSIVIGVCATILVAWGCAIWVNVFTIKPSTPMPGRLAWKTGGAEFHSIVLRMRNPAQTRQVTTLLSDHWIHTAVEAAFDNPLGTGELYADGRGWPMIALWCEFEQIAAPGSAPSWIIHGGLDSTLLPFAGSPLPKALPLRPAWRGLIIDIAFFSIAAWLLGFAPFEMRRLRRWQRGACLRCGYDMRATLSQTCSECGTPFRRRRKWLTVDR